MHTFTDRAQHESNGLVERKIGMVNEAVRAALLASDLTAYLWPEVYMGVPYIESGSQQCVAEGAAQSHQTTGGI